MRIQKINGSKCLMSNDGYILVSWDGYISFKNWNWTINEGSVPNLTISLKKPAMFYMRTPKYRIVFGKGDMNGYKGIKKVPRGRPIPNIGDVWTEEHENCNI